MRATRLDRRGSVGLRCGVRMPSGCGRVRRSPPPARNIRCRPPDAPARNARPSGDAAAIWRMTDAFTEPTSETIAPGFSAGAISFAIVAAGADRDRQDDEVGALGGLGRARRVAVAERQAASPSPPSRRAGSARRSRRRASIGARRARSTSRSARCRSARGGGWADSWRAATLPLRKEIGQSRPSRRNYPRAPPTKSCSAATTRRFASSDPTVMRSAFGKP